MNSKTQRDRETHLTCVDCGASRCADGSGNYHSFCTTAKMSHEEIDELINKYEHESVREIMLTAGEVSSHASRENLCRVEEIIQFAQKMDFHTLGIAMCSALMNEGRTTAKILRAHGFEVHGFGCRVGSLKKNELKAPEGCCDSTTISCNPLLQAQLLNEADTELNIVIGLCLGHDILFAQASEAPCTTLVVKDRALGNNPAASLHAATTISPYSRMLDPCHPFYKNH